MSFQKPAESNIELSEVGVSLASQLAKLHASALEDDVLPAMGMKFLERYYDYVSKLPHQLIIGCFEERQLCGFCQVSYSPLSIFKLIMVSPMTIFQINKLMLTKPRLFWRGIRQASYRPLNMAKQQIPEISFIAIKEEWQGCGLGKLMIEHVSTHSHKLGITELFTKTSNQVAKQLYLKHFRAKILASEKIDGNTYWYLSWKTNSRLI